MRGDGERVVMERRREVGGVDDGEREREREREGLRSGLVWSRLRVWYGMVWPFPDRAT